MSHTVQTRILLNQNKGEFYIDEGCFITELSNSSADAELSIARCRVEPGKTTDWHWLEGTSERYCVLSGAGSVEIGDIAPTTVVAGDVVIIPAGVRQRITNTGEDDLIFLAMCSPPFKPEIYRDCR